MLTVRHVAYSTKWSRLASTSASGDKYKVVVVGAGPFFTHRLRRFPMLTLD